MNYPLIVKNLGLTPYEAIWHKMKAMTAERTEISPDEVWLVEHFPVFTQGQAGKPEHILDAQEIPVIQTDRGGQVTYHGPGQLILYPLLDIRRKNIGIRSLIDALQNSVIAVLRDYQIPATAQPGAPGVYVTHGKIASLGIRIRRGCSYHGLSLNIAMDLAPFRQINPCGNPLQPMAQLSQFRPELRPKDVAPQLLQHFGQYLSYNNIIEDNREAAL